MDLSIIIPLYNSGHYLSTCLNSLLEQDIDEKKYEIIIINDGSTDNSLEVALDLEKKFNNVKVYSKTNGGVGSARNKGLEIARGTYIYFIDPDDYLAHNVCQLLLDTITSNDLDILTFKSRKTYHSNTHHEQPNLKNLRLSKIQSGIDYLEKGLYKNEVWWYMIKKDFLDRTKIRFIEDRWMEDAIITAQLFVKAERMSHLPIDAHRHLVAPESAMTSKEPKHYLRIIDDNRNAALVFEDLISDLKSKSINPNSLDRLRTRQQSFVFFMMVRILKSSMKFKDVKDTMDELSLSDAYPLNYFISEDYNNISYKILKQLLNKKWMYYILFIIFNPILKFIYIKK